MPIIDFTGGNYRDATRGMTLKALQERQKTYAQAAMEAAAPQQIASPWQGGGQLMGVLAAKVNEARAQSDEMAGRRRFAELLSGGLSPEEMGEAITLDPETALKYQTHTWDVEKATTEREEKRKDELLAHGWDVDAANARVQAEKEAAAERARVEAASQEDQQKAAAALSAQTAGQTAAENKRKEEAELSKVQKGPVTPEIAAKYGGDVARNPGRYQVNLATNEIEPISTTIGNVAPKEIYDAQDKLASIDTHMDDLNRALELNSSIVQGPIGSALADALGMDPTGWSEKAISQLPGGPEKLQQLKNTKEFYQLVSSGAMTRMAEELKGSTAYQEIMHYQDIFASPTATEETRRNALQGMLNALQKHRAVSEARLREYGAGDVAPYKYTPRNAPTPPAAGAGVTGGAGDAAGAPAAPAAGGAPESIDDIVKRNRGQ